MTLARLPDFAKFLHIFYNESKELRFNVRKIKIWRHKTLPNQIDRGKTMITI
jgi:hypothetical protein